MAVGAIFAEASLMDIILGVAACAIARQVLPDLSLMAAHAFSLGMLAEKREVGLLMVETDVLPVSGTVTAIAVLPEAAQMRIVFQMT